MGLSLLLLPPAAIGKGTAARSGEETGESSNAEAVSSSTFRLVAEGLVGESIRSSEALCALRLLAAGTTSILTGMLDVNLGIVPRFFPLSGSGGVGDSPIRERGRENYSIEKEREIKSKNERVEKQPKMCFAAQNT